MQRMSMKIYKHGVPDTTFNYQTFKRFYVRLVRHLFF